MSKPIVFDQDEVALCPNGHGPMLMVSMARPSSVWYDDSLGAIAFARPTAEARAHCRECRHTMIVADERG